MSNFDPNDPAAEIKYLKALERGKGWPAEYPDPAKVKKGKEWPAAGDAGKVKTPRTWTPSPAAARASIGGQGVTVSELLRAILAIGAAVAAALLID